MKAKQIEKLLRGLLENLISSIDDEEISSIIRDYSFITGGCIPSMLMGEYVNDFDIYFTSKQYTELVVDYYKKKDSKLTSSNKKEKMLEQKGVFIPTLFTENAINLTDKIQLITKFAGKPQSVVEQFDWQHIKSHFSMKDGLVISDDTYKLIVEKELIYTGSNYPLSSLLRLRKYIKKGWTVSTKTIVHIIIDLLGAFEPIKYSEYEIKTQKNNQEHKIIDKYQKYKVPENFKYQENKYEVSVDTLIEQLNGVDPLTVQEELKKHTGEHLSLKEILELL